MAPHKIAIPFVGPKVEALLLWRNVPHSAAVLAGATALYIFVTVSTLSPLAILLRALAFSSLLSLAWATGAHTFGRPGPPVPAILTEGIKQDTLQPLLDKALPLVNKALGFLGVLASGKNAPLSLKTVAVAFVASYVVAALPPLTLAYTVVLLSFTLPKVYELKKDDVDKLLDKAVEQLKQLWAKIDEQVLKKIPLPGGHGAPAKKEQ